MARVSTGSRNIYSAEERSRCVLLWEIIQGSGRWKPLHPSFLVINRTHSASSGGVGLTPLSGVLGSGRSTPDVCERPPGFALITSHNLSSGQQMGNPSP